MDVDANTYSELVLKTSTRRVQEWRYGATFCMNCQAPIGTELLSSGTWTNNYTVWGRYFIYSLIEDTRPGRTLVYALSPTLRQYLNDTAASRQVAMLLTGDRNTNVWGSPQQPPSPTIRGLTMFQSQYGRHYSSATPCDLPGLVIMYVPIAWSTWEHHNPSQ